MWTFQLSPEPRHGSDSPGKDEVRLFLMNKFTRWREATSLQLRAQKLGLINEPFGSCRDFDLLTFTQISQRSVFYLRRWRWLFLFVCWTSPDMLRPSLKTHINVFKYTPLCKCMYVVSFFYFCSERPSEQTLIDSSFFEFKLVLNKND